MAGSTSSQVNQSHSSPLLPHHSRAGTIASVVGLSIVMLVSLIANILMIAIFRLFKRVRKQVTNHFLINLAISDLVVTLATMPFWVIWEIDRWESLPKDWDRVVLLRCWTSIDILCEGTSIVNLAVVSVDRLYSVTYPFKHHTTVTPSLAHKIIFGAWGYAAATASIFLLETPWRIVIITVLAFFVPLTVMIVCYAKIVLAVRACRRRWARNPEGNKQLFGCIVNEYKTAKNLGVVMLAFVICWMPFFVSSLIGHHCTHCLPTIQSRIVIPSVVKWLHYLNSAVNPIIYMMFNPSYRIAFRSFHSWCMHKGNYRGTSYEAWYMGSRRTSTNSQRSGSVTHASNRNSYSSSHRPSLGSVVSARSDRPIIPFDKEISEEVFVAGTTNQSAIAENGVKKQNGGHPGNKKTISFQYSDTAL